MCAKKNINKQMKIFFLNKIDSTTDYYLINFSLKINRLFYFTLKVVHTPKFQHMFDVLFTRPFFKVYTSSLEKLNIESIIGVE